MSHQIIHELRWRSPLYVLKRPTDPKLLGDLEVSVHPIKRIRNFSWWKRIFSWQQPHDAETSSGDQRIYHQLPEGKCCSEGEEANSSSHRSRNESCNCWGRYTIFANSERTGRDIRYASWQSHQKNQDHPATLTINSARHLSLPIAFCQYKEGYRRHNKSTSPHNLEICSVNLKLI